MIDIAQVQDTVEGIPPEDLQEILARSRFSCESRWMMAMVGAAGWDTANRLNLEVGTAVGKGEMHRLMKLLGVDTPSTEDEFVFLVAAAMKLFTTKKYFDYEIEYPGPGRVVGVVNECYAWTKVREVGVEDDYECGCFGMRRGWYMAMGLDPTEKVLKCMKDGDDRCEIMIESHSFPHPSSTTEPGVCG